MKSFSQLLCIAVFLLTHGSAYAGEPVVIATGTQPNHPQQPQLCIDAEGVIHVAFGAKDDVRYCRSEDGGKSFTETTNLPPYRVLALGMRRGPRIAASGDAVCISVIGGQHGKDDKGNLLVFRSADKGKNWSGPVVVNDVPASAREGLHAMAASPQGQLVCVWLDLRNKRTEIMASLSNDQGKSWGENLLVYQSPDGSVCECCNPSVAYDAKEGIHVMWRNQIGGARDMYVSSGSAGKRFGKAQKLGSGTWPLDACPMDGGSIATLPNGEIATAWRRDKSVYLAAATGSKEQLLGTGEQPWVAATGAGPYVAWVAKRGGPLFLQKPKQAKPVELSRSAGDPCIVAESKKDGLVVVAWEERSAKESKIVCQVVSDLAKPMRK